MKTENTHTQLRQFYRSIIQSESVKRNNFENTAREFYLKLEITLSPLQLSRIFEMVFLRSPVSQPDGGWQGPDRLGTLQKRDSFVAVWDNAECEHRWLEELQGHTADLEACLKENARSGA